VQRYKGIGKNRYKIEISIKIFSYSVKLDVRKKRGEGYQWVLQKIYSFAVVGLGKNSGALRWLIVQHTEKWLLSPKAAYGENVLNEKKYYFVLKVWLGKVHVKNEGCFQALPTDAYFVRVVCVGPFRGSVKLEMIQSADQIPRMSAILRGCPRYLIAHWATNL